MSAEVDYSPSKAGEPQSASGTDDFMLSKDVYFSAEVAQLEKQHLWPRVWQVACRMEELPSVGSFVTYQILDESVIVMRTAEERLQAFHNVCRHRGRRLLQGAGRTQQITCPFHGWRYNIDGTIKAVVERDDWAGCPKMTDADLKLSEVRVAAWQGWVFINFDPDAAPLAHYLAPVNAILDPYEFATWRYRWSKSVIVKCNWKVAVEAFNEFYHVTATHPQLQPIQDDISRCELHGDHSMMKYPPELNRIWGAPAARTGRPIPQDFRQQVVRGVREFEQTLKAIWSPRAVAATHRVLTELPADTPPEGVVMKMIEYWKEAALAEGAGWPTITAEQMAKAGFDWHVFPNFLFLMGPDGGLFYRVRPNGNDRESTLFDVWSLVRYVPGAEPDVKHELHANWRDADMGLILNQDFANMEFVHQGMKSSGFQFLRTNPIQESPLVNFHRALREYLKLPT
ncbi:MAG: aromatic ring-hydroxylating dioxygenase subunit alpha [Sinobacteraceae bacterium]|nr:aromatic ring-hydroxylating dioxygenase subunit alpha [Nevskiaceae bacterium]